MGSYSVPCTHNIVIVACLIKGVRLLPAAHTVDTQYAPLCLDGCKYCNGSDGGAD